MQEIVKVHFTPTSFDPALSYESGPVTRIRQYVVPILHDIVTDRLLISPEAVRVLDVKE